MGGRGVEVEEEEEEEVEKLGEKRITVQLVAVRMRLRCERGGTGCKGGERKRERERYERGPPHRNRP